MPRFYERVDAEVDVDPAEYWDQCTDREKRELADCVIDEGLATAAEETWKGGRGQTYTDQELIRLLDDMWKNRQHIDLKIVDQLRAQLKEKKIL